MLATLLQEGALSYLEVEAAVALGRLAGEERPTVLLGLAVALRHARHGHTRCELQPLASLPLPAAEGPSSLSAPELGEWLEALRSSPLVEVRGAAAGDAAAADAAEGIRQDVLTSGQGARPLVLRGDALFLRRHWEAEREVAERLALLAAETWDEASVAALVNNRELTTLLPAPTDPSGCNWQRVAVCTALLRRFAVISGGPGTGKTTTVARLLAALVLKAQQEGRGAPRILLVAPTGKAAARLAESLGRGLADLGLAPELDAAIPRTALTLHRALGATPDGRFRFHREHPLLADVVVVDEVSMVDLQMLRALLAAIPPHARLVLLGDGNQLASVDAGSVLGDLVEEASQWERSPWLASALARLGCALPVAGALPFPSDPSGAPPRVGGLGDVVVSLRHSYRFRAEGGVGALARCVLGGDADGTEALLRAGHAGLAWVEAEGDLPLTVRQIVEAGYAPLLDAQDPAAALAHQGDFRILAAHRTGGAGVQGLVEWVERQLLVPRRRGGRGPRFQPLLITRNDRETDLANGDLGLLAASDDDGGAVAWFAHEAGPRAVGLGRLPPHESALALTIHKSQGSEFRHVLVVLPPVGSPLLTRELFYTALTRAQERVTVVGSAASLRTCVTTRVSRSSGLVEQLQQRFGVSGP